jgi:hypothetical protein
MDFSLQQGDELIATMNANDGRKTAMLWENWVGKVEGLHSCHVCKTHMTPNGGLGTGTAPAAGRSRAVGARGCNRGARLQSAIVARGCSRGARRGPGTAINRKAAG